MSGAARLERGEMTGEEKKAFAVFVLGLASARTAAIGISYSFYSQSDAGLLTDGGTILNCLVFVLLAICLVKRKTPLDEDWAERARSVVTGIAPLAVLGLLAMGVCSVSEPVYFLGAIIGTFFVALTVLFWVCAAKGADTTTSAVWILSAGIVSELLITIGNSLPSVFELLFVFLLAVLQAPLFRLAKRQPLRNVELVSSNVVGYYQLVASSQKERAFMLASFGSIALLSFVDGCMRGFPNGDPVVFVGGSRSFYVILTIAICACATIVALRQIESAFSVGIWFVFQGLGFLALILYAAFPDRLDYGAAVVTALNTLIILFKNYITVSFVSNGSRPALYYALLVYVAVLLPRAIARVAFIGVARIWQIPEPVLIIVLGALLMASAQVCFWSILHFKDKQAEAAMAVPRGLEESASDNSSIVERLLDMGQGDSMSDVRFRAMESDIAQLGNQFLLSKRETEVLTLFALGHTYAAIAEELVISQSTVHSHMKRIYGKTNMHSRREILDYLTLYGS